MKLLEELSSAENKNQICCANTIPTNDPNTILSHFSEILQEYNILKTGNENWNLSFKTDGISLDLNNNETGEIKKHCFKLEDANNNICYDDDNERFATSSENSKKDVNDNCSYFCDGRCPNYYREINGRYVRCCTEKSVNGNNKTGSLKCEPCSKSTRPIENAVDISTSIRNTFDKMYLNQ